MPQLSLPLTPIILAVGAYEAIQDLESIRYIRDALHRPNEADLNAKRYAAALIFSLTYGKRLNDDDKDLDAVVEVLEDFIHDCYPGSHLVDTFPILDRLPDFLAPWRDGARKKHARDSKVSKCEVFYPNACLNSYRSYTLASSPKLLYH